MKPNKLPLTHSVFNLYSPYVNKDLVKAFDKIIRQVDIYPYVVGFENFCYDKESCFNGVVVPIENMIMPLLLSSRIGFGRNVSIFKTTTFLEHIPSKDIESIYYEIYEEITKHKINYHELDCVYYARNLKLLNSLEFPEQLDIFPPGSIIEFFIVNSEGYISCLIESDVGNIGKVFYNLIKEKLNNDITSYIDINSSFGLELMKTYMFLQQLADYLRNTLQRIVEDIVMRKLDYINRIDRFSHYNQSITIEDLFGKRVIVHRNGTTYSGLNNMVSVYEYGNEAYMIKTSFTDHMLLSMPINFGVYTEKEKKHEYKNTPKNNFVKRSLNLAFTKCNNEMLFKNYNMTKPFNLSIYKTATSFSDIFSPLNITPLMN